MKTHLRDDKQINKLKKLFDEQLNSTFPQDAPTAELQSLKNELALYDGHVAGLVSSYLNNLLVNKNLVNINSQLEQRIRNVYPKTPNEKKSKTDLIHYKHRLDKLITILSRSIEHSLV